MSINPRTQKILKMVELAMLVALVIVLQMLGSFIKIGPLPMSFVLVPIVIGACILGSSGGAFLGAVFGVITMIMGIAGIDAFVADIKTGGRRDQKFHLIFSAAAEGTGTLHADSASAAAVAGISHVDG